MKPDGGFVRVREGLHGLRSSYEGEYNRNIVLARGALLLARGALLLARDALLP